jgi:N-acetylneuraminate synthase
MNLESTSFAGRSIGFSGNRNIIAEIGVNDDGSMERAKAHIRNANEGGAHGSKFQTYKAHLLAIKDSPAYWD